MAGDDHEDERNLDQNPNGAETFLGTLDPDATVEATIKRKDEERQDH